MFPLDPKMLRMLKQLGIKQEQIDATAVIIKCSNRNLIIKNPAVSKIKFRGQDILQVSGKIEESKNEESTEERESNEEDIRTVIDKTGVSAEKAKNALIQSKGDLAEAIIKLSA